MKLVQNTGSDRVIDLIRPALAQGHRLDMVTAGLSLFAFAEVADEAGRLARCRLLLPPDDAELGLLGSEADRAARNRLHTRWLATRLAEWMEAKVDLRRAVAPVPQGTLVLRDGDTQPLQALMGSLAFTTDGLGP